MCPTTYLLSVVHDWIYACLFLWSPSVSINEFSIDTSDFYGLLEDLFQVYELSHFCEFW